jgi:RNA polymerase sigma-70 factor (ECF subfamily)
VLCRLGDKVAVVVEPQNGQNGILKEIGRILPMERDDTDEALMLRYRDGDASAFQILYQRHKGPLYRYLLRQGGDPALAEELFQDVWLKLIGARENYRVAARFTTFLYRLAHNRLIDHYRSHARARLISFEDGDPPLAAIPGDPRDQPEQRTDREHRAKRLLAVLAELPEAQREAFLLREEAGLSLEAMAEVTGVARETVKSRLRYAVAKLRAALGGEV